MNPEIHVQKSIANPSVFQPYLVIQATPPPPPRLGGGGLESGDGVAWITMYDWKNDGLEMDFWIHDGFLNSRWISAFTMRVWIHDRFLNLRLVFGFTIGFWIRDLKIRRIPLKG